MSESEISEVSENETEDAENQEEQKPESYVVSEEIIETTWKCARCGAQNMGRDMRCPSCGSPKTADAAYTVSADGPAVTDAEQLEEAAAGLHWVCPYCEGQNRGNNPTCSSCGATVAESERKPAKGDLAGSSAPVSEKAAPAAAAKKGTSPLLFVIIAIILGIIIYFVLASRESGDTVTVKSLSWSRTITIERKALEEGKDWEEDIKEDDDLKGATISNCVKKEKGRKKVKEVVKKEDGTPLTEQKCEEKVEDLKNGYAKKVKECADVPVYEEKEVPVEANYCEYKIYRWKKLNSFKAGGQGNQDIKWPEVPEGATAAAGSDETREQREAKYIVVFSKSSGEDINYSAKEADFAGFAVGNKYNAVLANFGKEVKALGEQIK